MSQGDVDRLFDVIKDAYVGTEPWYVGPAHLGMEVAPEAIALEPLHFRTISRIHVAVCEVLGLDLATGDPNP